MSSEFDIVDYGEAPSSPAPAKPSATTTEEPPTHSSVFSDTPPKAAEDTPSGPDYRKRRRRVVLTGVIGLAILVLFVRALPASSPDSTPATSSANAQAGSTAGKEKVQTILTEASAYEKEHGSFVGYAPPGVFTAANRTTFVMAVSVEGTCYYSGIVPGKATAVQTDSTAKACTHSALAQVQKALDSSESAENASARQTALQKLRTGERAAAYYAVHNVQGGSPSFQGLPWSEKDVALTSLSPASITLETQERPGLCLDVVVTTASGAGQPFERGC